MIASKNDNNGGKMRLLPATTRNCTTSFYTMCTTSKAGCGITFAVKQ
ncbi:hypothetical protein [Chitinophaga varians]|nr:hypothetical protein [Chitinophaga varians]